jgi:hypothetical protein
MCPRRYSVRAGSALLTAALASGLGACGETSVEIFDPADAGVEAGPPPLDLDRGLLAYFPFDETEPGTLALDASGNEHHGAPSPSPPTPALSVPPTGFANPRSLRFSGTQEFIDLGGPPGLDISGTVTVSAWVRLLAFDGFRNIVAHGWHHQPDQELALRVQGVGAVPLEFGGVDSPHYQFIAWDGVDHGATAPMPEGDRDTWHHLCGVYDGERYRLYRDGELLAEREDAVAPMRVEEAWAIGARGMPDRTMPETLDTRYLNGMIDEVRIYGRALSEDEVRALFRR